jgi:hypothetical protein
VPDTVGTYELEFTYTVGDELGSDTAQVLASTTNIAPVVDVSDITWSFDEGGPVLLDGSDSFDPDGDKLFVEWQLLNTPDLSQRLPTDIENADRLTDGSKLAGPDYYTFFAGCMLLTALFFIPVAMRYKETTYIQDEDDGSGTGDDGDENPDAEAGSEQA